jgi:outer membrane protein OmpA-like peptidoglycan-associated protein
MRLLHASSGNQAVQRLARAARRPAAAVPELARRGISDAGERLPFLEKLEASFGSEHELSGVRAHVGGRALAASRALDASAYAHGEHVAFGRAPSLEEAAHEAAHVVQQRRGDVAPDADGFGNAAHERTADEVAARVVRGEGATDLLPENAPQRGESTPAVQRRLLATETTPGAFDRFRALAEAASGALLAWDPATHLVTQVGSVGAPLSDTFALNLDTIITDTTDDAEVNFGDHQATAGGGGVYVGQFPVPTDMSGSQVQLIDMDDIESIEATTPGFGVAFLAHELWENYEGHRHAATNPGADAYPDAHSDAIEVEGQVLGDVFGPGRRVANASMPTPTGSTIAYDFENYYLLIDADSVTSVSPTDIAARNSRIRSKLPVSQHTIEHFGLDEHAVPAGASATLAAVNAVLAAHPLATLEIDGFCDSSGGAEHNQALSERRAANVLAALALSNDGRAHTLGRGATAFVVPNDTPEHRARNRRVVLIITEPAP